MWAVIDLKQKDIETAYDFIDEEPNNKEEYYWKHAQNKLKESGEYDIESILKHTVSYYSAKVT